MPRTVLVVCYGNLCRSPMAEALLRDRLPPEWTVESAGTHAWSGSGASGLAASVIEEEAGLDLSGHRSRPLEADSIGVADHVFTMSRNQALAAAHLEPEAASRIRLLGAFAPETGDGARETEPGGPPAGDEEIADPVGGDVETFRATYRRLRDAVEAATRWLLAGADPDDAPPPVSRWNG